MNFFEHQDEARKRTALLVFLFIVALICIVAATYAALSWGLAVGHIDSSFWNLERFGAVAAGVTLLVAAASAIKTSSLSGSGAKVAEMMGGRPINNLTGDPHEQLLMNVVEEMAIASGVPVPLVYLLENEPGINAFAAGHGAEDAVVAVTAGALRAFTRDELQGVIAHEFSHILNRDVRLNTRLSGIVFGILVIALTGRIIVSTMGRGRIRTSNDKGGGAIMVIVVLGLVLMAVGYIGLFFGKLIKQAVSRQREFLADASAVQFTRNPDGLASALKRIAGWNEGSQLQAANAEEISHFFFADGMKKGFFSTMLSTHPPLEDRISRLDPSFDPAGRSTATPRHASNDSAQIAALTDSAAVDTTPKAVVDSVGTTEPERFFYDEAIVAEIPIGLRQTISSSLGAVALTYSLLLDPDSSNRSFQLDLLRERVDPIILEEIEQILPDVLALDHFARLPALDLAMPALRSIAEDQYDSLIDTLDTLAASDKHLSLFEFCVRSIVVTRLAANFGRKVAVSHRVGRETLEVDSQVLLSALARVGNPNKDDALSAFRAGSSRLNVSGPLEFLSPNASRIESAISRLAQVPYSARELVVDACAHCVLSDEEVTIDEAELLRVVIVSLGCPLPPFLPRLAN